MFYFLFLMAVLSNTACLWLDYKDKSSFSFIWMLNYLFVLIPMLLLYGGGMSHYELAAAFIFVCNTVYFFSVILVKSLVGVGEVLPNFDLTYDRRYFWIIAGGLLCIPAVFYFNGVTYGYILESNLTSKRELGFFYLVLVLVCAFVFPQIIYTSHNRRYVLTLFIFVAFVVVLLYFRSRSILGFLFLPLAYYLIFFKRRGKLYVSLLVFLAFIASQLVKVIRYQGSLADGLSANNISESAGAVFKQALTTGDFSIVKVFLDVVRDCSLSSWCGNWTYFNKIASKFFEYHDPVQIIEYVLYDNYVVANVGGSLHPTSYGVAYADGGGFLGCVLFAFLAGLRFFNSLIMGRGNAIHYLGFSMYFCLFFSRGSVYNGFFVFLVAIMVYFFVTMCGAFGKGKSAP